MTYDFILSYICAYWASVTVLYLSSSPESNHNINWKQHQKQDHDAMVFWKLHVEIVCTVGIWFHYNDVIIITSLTIVYSTVYSGVGQGKHQSSASLAFVRGIHRGPVNSPHKRPVTRKIFPFGDVIMSFGEIWCRLTSQIRLMWMLSVVYFKRHVLGLFM